MEIFFDFFEFILQLKDSKNDLHKLIILFHLFWQSII